MTSLGWRRTLLLLMLVAPVFLPTRGFAQPARPNNIVGLNLARLHQSQYLWAASDLVNANGGDWGYVTVTWTRDDRDAAMAEYNLQQFLDRCFEFHLQPIIRVGTRFDSARKVWLGPEWDEPIKWRDLFNRVEWPVKRVWIIAGNEPNLGREWNGEVDPGGYARYLDRFMSVFQGAERFRVVNGPLDVSNGTQLPEMLDAIEFIEGMRRAVPTIFERLPAWASNPYRVPSAGSSVRYTHRAYEAELEAIGRDMPVIITEANLQETDDDQEVARFFDSAFRDWMTDPRIVAATPLFWHPDTNVFWMFSLSQNGSIKSISPTYERLRTLPRVAGRPDFVTPIANSPRPSKVVDTQAAATTSVESLVAPPAVAPTTVAHRPPPAEQIAAQPPAMPVSAAAGSERPARRYARVANTGGRGANVRELPALAGVPVTVVPDGSSVALVGLAVDLDELAWQRVRLDDGTEGWIASALLVESTDGSEDP